MSSTTERIASGNPEINSNKYKRSYQIPNLGLKPGGLVPPQETQPTESRLRLLHNFFSLLPEKYKSSSFMCLSRFGEH
jgi:hypothetical protein